MMTIVVTVSSPVAVPVAELESPLDRGVGTWVGCRVVGCRVGVAVVGATVVVGPRVEGDCVMMQAYLMTVACVCKRKGEYV
jgi:hypothetical protein